MPLRSFHTGIEAGFERFARRIVLRPWGVIAGVLLLTAGLTAGLPRLTADFSTDSYLHAEDGARKQFDAFRARYGPDNLLLLGIQAPDIFDPGFLTWLRDLHRELENEVPHVDEVESLINARSTRGEGDELIVEELLERWPESPEGFAAVKRRALANPLYLDTLISRDRSFTAITICPSTYSSASDPEGDAVLAFEPTGEGGEEAPVYLTRSEEAQLIQAVSEVMARHEHDEYRIHLAGHMVVAHHLETISARDMPTFMLLSLASMTSILFGLFRRATAALLPLLVVTLAVVSSLGAMAWLGIPFSSPTQIVPTFLLAVGICSSVHILSMVYRRLALGDGKNDAIAWAMGHSGLAVLMTSLTTAGGLASFAGAKILPIAQLGWISPIGVILILAYTLTLLPALLAVVPMAPPRSHMKHGVALGIDRLLARMADFSTGHPRTILTITFVICGVGLHGTKGLRFGHHAPDWLFENDPIRVASEAMDAAFEGVSAVEVVVDSGSENGLYDPEVLRRLEAAERFAASIREGPVRVGKAISIVDVVKEIHQALNENRPAFYALPESRDVVAQELLLFENSSDDLEKLTGGGFREARLTLRSTYVDSIYYRPFLETLRAGLREQLGEDLDFDITGTLPLSSRAFSLLLPSLLRSYGAALLIITPMMIVLIGDVRRGLLAMIPNLIPVYLTLALMGWLDISLNIATLIIGSIIIGVAVDDTIHFMHKFNRYFDETGDARDAVRLTFSTTGTAMLVTSIVLGVSFSIFTLGHFYSAIHFGILAAFATVIAFLADLFVAPALMMLVARAHEGRELSDRLVMMSIQDDRGDLNDRPAARNQ